MSLMTSKTETKIKELGFNLPEIVTPIASYVPAKQVGNLIFTSGQLPMVKGE
jgi:enamine deaminase RidA (YjgF/YER057c/UK114 family)